MILANFEVQGNRKCCQVDFVVVTRNYVSLYEHKAFNGILRGSHNGPWKTRRGGDWIEIARPNPLGQALDAKFALSDAMGNFANSVRGIPHPTDGKFFKEFDAAVVISPDLEYGSLVPRHGTTEGFKAFVCGEPEAMAILTTKKLSSSWRLEHWERFAMFLDLKSVSEEAAIDERVYKAELALDEYSRTAEVLALSGTPPLLPGINDDRKHLRRPYWQKNIAVLSGKAEQGRPFTLGTPFQSPIGMV